MAEITPAGRRQRDRIALRATIDSVIVAARYWRGAPDDPERRRKFLQLVTQAESRSAALDEQEPGGDRG